MYSPMTHEVPYPIVQENFGTTLLSPMSCHKGSIDARRKYQELTLETYLSCKTVNFSLHLGRLPGQRYESVFRAEVNTAQYSANIR